LSTNDHKNEIQNPFSSEKSLPLIDHDEVIPKVSHTTANRVFSDMTNLVSDQSINELCATLNKRQNQLNIKQNVDDENHEHESLNSQASLSCFNLAKNTANKKKKKQRLDPVLEKKIQNYECYKEYCKLKTIHDLIEKELKLIQGDNDNYEQTLEIMKENKARHEDELGYYLGIEDNKNKRIRRLATEIERKHKCLVVKCPKAYGSEGSLNQHLIRKHKLVYEEWMKRLALVEDANKKVSKEDKEKIRKDIEKISMTL